MAIIFYLQMCKLGCWNLADHFQAIFPTYSFSKRLSTVVSIHSIEQIEMNKR